MNENKDKLSLMDGEQLPVWRIRIEKLGVCLDEKLIVYSGTSVRSGRCFLWALVVPEIMSIHF